MNIPEPMTPPECDLRGLEYMPLLGQRLFGSEFNTSATDAEWRAGLTLWWAAWTQCPAASLPDEDAALCRLAELGRDLRAWRKVKSRALHGFLKCSDGRLYHPMLAEQALVAWEKRIKERERKAVWRAKKLDKLPEEPAGQLAPVPRDATRTGAGTEQGKRQGRDGQVPADGTRRDSSSVANATGAGAPLDLKKIAFDTGVEMLRANGMHEVKARRQVGMWVRERGEDWTVKAIVAAQGKADPVAYIQSMMSKASADAGQGHSLSDATRRRYLEMDMAAGKGAGQ